MANPTCSNCGGPTMSLEEQEIRAENARLKEELARVCALAKKFLDRPLFDLTATLLPMGDGVMETTPNSEMIRNDSQNERSKLIDLASAAMDELIKMVELNSHLWVKSPESGKEKLNHDEYEKNCYPFYNPKPNCFVTETTRETVLLCTNIAALIETFLDAITWINHSQYDESVVHQTYHPLVNSGITFGAHRWVATLSRHHQSLAILKSFVPSDDPTAICPSDKRSMSKPAQRMSDYLYFGFGPSLACKWDILHISNTGNNEIKIVSQNIPYASGVNPSIMLGASTSVWMPVSRKRVSDFLNDAQLRSEWEVLSNGGSMEEMVHIAKGEGITNSISILRADNAVNENKGNILYLQDSWTDSSGSMVVYSPISFQSLNMLMNGGDSSFVPLLPSGFSILLDGHSSNNTIIGSSSDGSGNSGYFLTVGLQILLSGLQTSNLTSESVDTVNELISCTI